MEKNRITIRINEEDLRALETRYGQEVTQKALRVTNTYTRSLQREATRLIREAGHVNEGKLANSITKNVSLKDGVIRGEVNAATEYALFIHEGAKRVGGKSIPHFVPFKVAPSLLLWAKRVGVIYEKSVADQSPDEDAQPKKRGRKKKKKQWYFKSAKGKEYPIDVKKGGLMVKQEAVKYFEKPLEKLSPEYFEKLREMI